MMPLSRRSQLLIGILATSALTALSIAAVAITVDLPPGRYELLCNFAGHYTAGMHTQLTVT